MSTANLMKSHADMAHEMSERANQAEEPGGPFTVKQAISRALHQRASQLHRMAAKAAKDPEIKALHEEKHKEHFDKTLEYATPHHA